MSCLSDCGCKQDQDTEIAEEEVIHVESSYQPLLEVSNAPEAIPLLPKGPVMQKYEAQEQQYQLLTLIGVGVNQTAQISLARHLSSGHYVAIRCIDLERWSEDISYVQNEILLTRQLQHENLLPYYNSFVSGCHVWVVMPLMVYGSTHNLMKSYFPRGFPEIAIALILRDILGALLYLHKQGFIHRSIRSSHILLNGNGRAVLTGLRYSCNIFLNGRWQTSVHAYPHDSKSNLNWLSPELLQQNLMGYSAKSDIYSVGVTAVELHNGVVPFAHLGPTQMLLEKLTPSGGQGFTHYNLTGNQKNSNISSNNSSDGSNNSVFTNQVYSEAFSSFVHLCLQNDPVTRPGTPQLQNHTFIRQCKKSQITMLDVLAKATHLIDKFGKTSVLKKDDSEEKEVPTEKLHTAELCDSWCFSS